MKLSNRDSMPFGKYGPKGSGKTMGDVPADYLLFIWENGLYDRSAQYREENFAVHDYIRDNFSALETKCPDKILKHRPEPK